MPAGRRVFRINSPPAPPGIDDLGAQLGDGILTTLHGGFMDPPGRGSNVIVLRYSIGGNDRTEFVIWSAHELPDAGQITVVDQEGRAARGTWQLHNPHLNVVDPAVELSIPRDFVNGYMVWMLPDDADGDYADWLVGDGNGVAAYAVIRAPAPGAAQTIPGTGFVIP